MENEKKKKKKTTRGNKICVLETWWNRERRTQNMEITIRDKSEIFYKHV